MILLSLDTSISRTGFAVGFTDGEPEFGSYSLPKHGAKQVGRYLADWEKWLSTMLWEHQADAVVIESPLLPKKNANIWVRRKLFGLVDTTEKICYQRAISCNEVPPSAIKRYMTGNGNADKGAVVDAVRTAGLAVENHDEADAVALWLLALSWFDRRDGTEHAQKWTFGRAT